MLSIPIPGETGIRNLLLKNLEKNKKIKTLTEVQYHTRIGLLKPDAFIQNGSKFIMETKLGPQPKLIDAITQLYDYLKYIENIQGGFAILLPEELRRPVPLEWLEHIAKDPKTKFTAMAIFQDNRNTQKFNGSLDELSEWIIQQVLEPPKFIQPDTSLAISVLNEAVELLTSNTILMNQDSIEDLFGGKNVFENILEYDEGNYPLNEMRKAASYLLVNQLLFYHVLSSNDPIKFPKIEEDYLKEPKDLTIYFNRVLEVDYTPTFGFDIASRLPSNSTDTLKYIIKAIKGIAPEKIKFDLLGKIFHDLIPFNIRKAVAAFYTNNEAAELLSKLTISNPNASIIDLACGSGTLLVAAYHRKKDLLERENKFFGSEQHKQFLEKDITGIDIMPFAAHLAVVHLSLQAPLYETEKIRVAVWDSTELKPDQSIPSIQKELKDAYKKPNLDVFFKGKPKTPEDAFITKGAVTSEGFGGDKIDLYNTDTVLMNPPFTRSERLPKEYKEKLDSRFKQYKKYIKKNLGLHGYFIFLADKFLKKGGIMGIVLPATILRVAATKGIRDLLIESYNIEYIITTYEKAAFSEAAQFREILLIAKKNKNIREKYKAIKSTNCLIVFLKKSPSNSEGSNQISDVIMVNKEKLIEGQTFENDFLKCRSISQNILKKSKNLFEFISTFDGGIQELWAQILEKNLSH